jgi:predicted NUDIX family phosphoesterase
MSHEEQILVVPASFIDSIGTINGFEKDVDRFLKPILASDQLSFQPRGAKQLIPYVLLQYTTVEGETQLFTYTRGGGSGEKRLHAKRSVGIGGHISQQDAVGDGDFYSVGMERELSEEVIIKTKYTESREGLIYDPSNEVGKVHLGVVHRFVLDAPLVESNEADLAEGAFVNVKQLLAEPEGLETWSQLAINALYR